MVIKLKKRINALDEGKLNAIFILFAVFFFPAIALTNYLFEIQSGKISQAYRLFNLLFSCYLIYRYAVKTKLRELLPKEGLLNFFKEKYHFILFLAFWAFYVFRIVLDLEVHNIHEIALISVSKSYFYLYAIGISFIPMLAAFTIRKFDVSFFKKYLYRYLIVLNIALILIFIVERFINHHSAYRFVVTKNEFDYFNAISIAVYAGLLIIMSFINVSKSYLNYLLIGLGSFLILTTASRGPILSILVALLFFLVLKDKKRGWKYLYLLLVMGVSVLINYLISFFFSDYFENVNAFFHRINNVNADQSTISRLKITKDAIAQIVEAPLFGSHFFVLESKMYAHNIMLDILVSTGFFGLLLIIPIFLLFAKRIMAKSAHTVITTIAFFFFLNTLTSGGCYNMYEFWIIFALVVTYRNNIGGHNLIEKV